MDTISSTLPNAEPVGLQRQQVWNEGHMDNMRRDVWGEAGEVGGGCHL